MTAFAFQHIYSLADKSQTRAVALELLLREFKGMRLQEMLSHPWVFESEIKSLFEEKAKVLNKLIFNFPSHQFFVNVSPAQAANADFLPSLEYFAKNKVPASSIALEITENWSNQIRELAIAQLMVARRMGFTLVIDDFGAGNLTLASLAQLSPAIVKLDRTLVAAAAENKQHANLLQSVVRMVHDIGAKALAEGVETMHILQLALEAQCDFAQGYHLDRPSDLRLAKMAS